MQENIDLAAISRLKKIYSNLPGIQCKGLCTESCTAIGYSRAESDLIRLAGQELPKLKEGRCSALTPRGKCSIYGQRPLVCRLFGLVEAMRCPHGCLPDRFLTQAEEHDILKSVLMAGTDLADLSELNISEDLQPLLRAMIAAAQLTSRSEGPA